MRLRLALTAALIAAIAGCGQSTVGSSGGARGSSGSSGAGSSGGSTSSGGTTGAGSTTGASGTGATTGHGAVTALAITPPSYSIDVGNGGPGSFQFTARATFADGTSANVPASWSFDRPDLASVDANGTVSAAGSSAGVGTLTASYLGASATAQVSIVQHVIRNVAGLSASDQALFDHTDANPSGTMLYPYDGTVFARGLLAPEVMWSGGSAGDAYRAVLSEQLYQATVYFNADPPSDVAIPQDLWDALTGANQGRTDPLTLDLERLSGGQAHAAMHESWTIAPGSLRGSIYYWAVSTGQLMKITPGASTPTVLFDSGDNTALGTPAPANYDGTLPPWSTGGGGKRCVACHTVSKDGSTAVAVFERKDNSASPWGTIDLSSSTPSVVQMSPYDSSAIYLGLTPNGMYAVENDVGFNMRLYDAHLGTLLASALDSFPDHTADPAFSPDGSKLAFSSNVTGGYPVEFSRADLDVMDFDASATAFSNRRTVVSGGSGVVAFPSFTPDSQWLVYQYGDYSRAKYGNNQVGHDDLWLSDLAGTAGPVMLANASGASLDPRDQHLSYQPTVNPISVGGYTWVVFVSPRDYGNKMLSASDPTYENRKQLWVAAVDASPQPGVDPSHPAFWLPGQDLSTVNMSGYWALEACHATGGSCTQGFECCSGYCSSAGTCTTQPTGGCSQVGDACTSDASCCGNPQNTCVGGYCSPVFK